MIAYCDYAFNGVPSTDPLLLAASIRRFGGALKNAPIWYLHSSEKIPPPALQKKAKALDVELKPYSPELRLANIPFAMKGIAAAEAERLAEGVDATLMWLDRDSLVLRDIDELSLRPGHILGYRPVNSQNIGQEANAAPDAFWARAYALSGADPAKAGTTTSYIDGKELRFYAAAGLMAVRPERGILRSWAENLLKYAQDPELVAACRSSQRRMLFMHQAAYSVAAARATTIAERVEFSPLVMYPLNLYASDPESRRPARIDDIVSLRYDAALEGDDWKKFPMSDELRAWMEAALK